MSTVPGRPTTPVTLSERVRSELEHMARCSSLSYSRVRRAKVILLAADGYCNKEIARRVGLSRASVALWRKRFLAHGVAALCGKPHTGRKRTVGDDEAAELARKALSIPPSDGTFWTVRKMAAETGLSKSTVDRLWRSFGINSDHDKPFHLLTASVFAHEVLGIVGLYLNPPDSALVLCTDEQKQILPRDGIRRASPAISVDAKGILLGDLRSGSKTLFTALQIASESLQMRTKRRRRQEEFLYFLRQIDACVPAQFSLHLIVDNDVIPGLASVARWTAARPRYQVHCMPSFATWLLLMELSYDLTRQRSTRPEASHTSAELTHQIKCFGQQSNLCRQPFGWIATTESMVENGAAFV